MARRRRWFFEGVPLHVHQRGNNRSEMFRDDVDRVVFRAALLEATRKHGVAVHAWVFMNTHFHLLATPTHPDSVPRMMQQIGRRYVPFFNKRHHRTGTLWEGRYSAHIVDSDVYWYRCVRYIELNPVRALMVDAPSHHRWSSYQALAQGAADALITPHALYTALGHSDKERQLAYRTLCEAPLTVQELAAIRNALRTGLTAAELPELSEEQHQGAQT